MTVRWPATERSGRWLLMILLALLALWGGVFIFQSSFIVGGERIFCLFDDAMISMTYARNLVDGYGLNWARHGDPVEGFTCPLWTAMMVPVNALPLALEVRSLLVQLFSLLLLLGHVALVARLAGRHFSASGVQLWLPAAGLTAFTYSLNFWSLMGMETALQAVLISGSAYLTLELLASRGSPGRLGLVLALAVLHRPDMVILLAVCVGVLWLGRREVPVMPGGAERPWIPWLWILGPPVAAGMVYEIFRLAYFGDPLPNTYYLKLVGTPLAIRVSRGFLVLWNWLRPMLVPVAAVLAGAVWTARRRWAFRLGLALVLSFTAYSVWVGGDAWERSPVGANRFIAPVLPMFYLLFNGLLAAGRERLGQRRQFVQAAPGAVLTLALLLTVNGLWLHPHAQGNRSQFLLQRPHSTAEYRAINLRDVRYVQRILEPGGTLAVVFAGVPAFFTDYRLADTLGYSDRRIAHMDPVVSLTLDRSRAFRPGHLKWDYDYLLGELQPDVVHRVWGISGQKRREVMQSFGYYRRRQRVWVRLDSDRVRPDPKGQSR